MNSKEFSSNKKNKIAKQTTQNLKICEKKRIFYDSVTKIKILTVVKIYLKNLNRAQEVLKIM